MSDENEKIIWIITVEGRKLLRKFHSRDYAENFASRITKYTGIKCKIAKQKIIPTYQTC